MRAATCGWPTTASRTSQSGGRWLGDIETPPNGRVWDIGNDYVLGVWQDELDVQQVRMYRLVKGGG